MQLPLGRFAYKRAFGRGPEIVLLNRFFETAPNNLETQSALLARPATSLLLTVGEGPIRGNFAMPGFFDSNLFTVSDTELYMYDGTTADLINGVLTDTGSNVRWGPTNVGGTERLFVCDGLLLQYFQGQAYEATLTLTPGAIADDVVRIGADYYQFTNGSVDAGTPDGTVSSPWLVSIGASDAQALANLRAAVNADGTAGTQYSTATTPNFRGMRAVENSSTTLKVRFQNGGPPPSPSIALSVTATGSADGLAWSSATPQPGALALYGVEMPDDVAARAIDVIDGFVLVMAGAPYAQRVYFLRPGEIEIDGLDFFEAESEPDQLNDIVVVGDQIWLIGATTTDVYYPTGNSEAPFARGQGRPFPIGGIGGTCIKVGGTLVIAGTDNSVYLVGDGPRQISTNGIAERLRLARETERDNS